MRVRVFTLGGPMRARLERNPPAPRRGVIDPEPGTRLRWVLEVPLLPILPLIDLLILLSTGSLLIGFVLKAIALTTRYRPSVLGFSSLDFVIVTGVGLGLALVLAARTYVKLNEHRLLAVRSAQRRSRMVPIIDEDEYAEPPAEQQEARAELR